MNFTTNSILLALIGTAAAAELRGAGRKLQAPRQLQAPPANQPCFESYYVSSENGCSYQALLEAVQTQIDSEESCAGRSAKQEVALFGLAKEIVEDSCDKSFRQKATEDGLDFVDITGENKVFTKAFFDGGTYFMEPSGGADRMGVNWAARQSYPASRIEQIYQLNAFTRPVEMPKITNFESCETRSAMCCWVDNARDPTIKTNTTSDLCLVDMSRDPQSSHVQSGYSVFPDSKEGVSCHGFAWSKDASDPSSLFRGNNLFHVSMYNPMRKLGSATKVAGAPMCGCLEQMPVVSRADCTEIKRKSMTFGFAMEQDSLDVFVEDLEIEYKPCEGVKGANDLEDHYQKLVADGKATKSELAKVQDVLVGEGNCARAIEYFDKKPCNEDILIVSETFENRNTDGWSVTRLDKDADDEFSTFLGRFGPKSQVQKTYTVPQSALEMKIQFDFYEIGDFNGDKLYIYIDNDNFNLEFNGGDEGKKRGKTPGGMSYKMISLTEPTIDGFNGIYNSQQHRIFVTVPQKYFKDGKLKVRFYFSTNQDVGNESSGIDNVKVYATVPCNRPVLPNKLVVPDAKHAKVDGCSRLFSSEDFESDALTGWKGKAKVEKDGNFTNFLGRLGPRESVYKDYDVPKSALGAKVQFDFYEIDSWENNYLYVYLDSDTIKLGPFNFDKDEGTVTGKTSYKAKWEMVSMNTPTQDGFDELYIDQKHRVYIILPKSFISDGKLRIKFYSYADQKIADESAGIDNIKLSAIVPCEQEQTIVKAESTIFKTPECEDIEPVATEDFENKRLVGWRDGAKLAQGGNFTTFLGRLGPSQQAKKFYSVPSNAKSVKIQFDLYEIGSWDGDRAYVYVDRQAITLGPFNYDKDEGTMSGTNSGIKWEMVSLDKPQETGFNDLYIDQRHRVYAIIPRRFFSDGLFELWFYSGTNSEIEDEAMGIDNIIVSAVYGCR